MKASPLFIGLGLILLPMLAIQELDSSATSGSWFITGVTVTVGFTLLFSAVRER